MMTNIRKLSLSAIAVAFITFSALPVHAQEEGIGDSLPAVDTGLFPPQAATAEETVEYDLPPGADTHPMMRLTPDKSEIINLDTDVRSLIVGNPMHLNVIMDTTKRLVLVPRSPGATSFTALNADGKVVMQRHVIVNGPEEKYIRIRRSCDAARSSGQAAANCQDVSVFYCPQNLCHSIDMVTSSRTVSASGYKSVAPAGGGSVGGGIGGMGSEDNTDPMGSDGSGTMQNPFDLLMKALQNSAQGQGEQPAE